MGLRDGFGGVGLLRGWGSVGVFPGEVGYGFGVYEEGKVRVRARTNPHQTCPIAITTQK